MKRMITLLEQISAIFIIVMMLGVNTQVFGIRYAGQPKTKGQPAAQQPVTQPVVTQPTEEELEAAELMPSATIAQQIATALPLAHDQAKAKYDKEMAEGGPTAPLSDRPVTMYESNTKLVNRVYELSEQSSTFSLLFGKNPPTLKSTREAVKNFPDLKPLRDNLPMDVSLKDVGSYFYDQFKAAGKEVA